MKQSTLDLWYKALHSPSGIVVRTEDFVRARARLYADRASANDPQLVSLSICASPTDSSELWIVHRTTDNVTQADAPRPDQGDDELPSLEL